MRQLFLVFLPILCRVAEGNGDPPPVLRNDAAQDSPGVLKLNYKPKQKTFLLTPKGSPLSCETAAVSPSILIENLSLRNSKDKSKILEFPGCFDISAQFQFLDTTLFDQAAGGDPKVLAHENWEWLQGIEESLAIGCNDTEPNGCNGKGNGCYYCDFCDRLKNVNEDAKLNSDEALTCPDPSKRQIYDYTETRCIDDWGHLDKNGNGRPDFLEKKEFDAHRELLKAMQIKNFGSMRLQFRLSMMETEEQKEQMDIEKSTILNQTGQGMPGWHRRYKEYWLPVFRQRNLLGCATVLFDVEGELS